MSGITAAAIAVGVGAASSIASAKIQSNAAQNAAKTQAAAGDKALAAQQAGFEQQQKQFAPYLQAGQGAVGNLSQLASQPRPVFTGIAGGQQQGVPPPGGNLSGLGSQPPQGTPQLPGGPGQPGMQQPMGGGPAMGQRSPGGLVRVQAPTGEVAMLPQDQAQAAVQKGAKLL